MSNGFQHCSSAPNIVLAALNIVERALNIVLARFNNVLRRFLAEKARETML
jgi:hypothetical protein